MSWGLPAFPAGLGLTPHLYPPLCSAGLQADIVALRYMHTRSPHMYYKPPKQTCIFHFIDCLSVLSCPLILCSALCFSCMLPGCCFIFLFFFFLNHACQPPPLSQPIYFIYSLLSKACLGAAGKSHFIKISMQTGFLLVLRHHTDFGQYKGAQRCWWWVWGGDNQLIWSSALGNGERKRS